MRHIILSNGWNFDTNPFAAFRCELVFGRNKRDRAFLPVNGVTPIVQYVVTANMEKEALYAGTDKVAAEKAKTKYDSEKNDGSCWSPKATIDTSQPTLPKGTFKVIKTKEKGTIMVVNGVDNTNRCLLFVGCSGGFRGGVSVLGEGTTGNILKECSASNNCDSAVEVIVILEKGQTIAFHSSGRRTNEVYLYTWNGESVQKQHYSKSEWDARNAPEEKTEDL